MELKDIYQFFREPPPTYLCEELAVCFVLSILLDDDSYGTQLIQLLEKFYPDYRLSDTILYNALKFLVDEKIVISYLKKVEGRGRPRRMYQISPHTQNQAEELAQLWRRYMAERSSPALVN